MKVDENLLHDVEHALKRFLKSQRGRAAYVSAMKLRLFDKKLRKHSVQAVGKALLVLLEEKHEVHGWRLERKMKSKKNYWVFVRC